MRDLAMLIAQIFTNHRIPFEYEQTDDNRVLFRWNELMYDPGLGAHNVMLDYTIDPGDNDIYLGLIRIPAAYRGKGIGTEIVETIKRYAEEIRYSVLLESADENLDFWKKESFAAFLHDEYGFWIMGYGGEGKRQWMENWQHMRSELYADPLMLKA
jgi:GNAT superfamily N-acetyltransferase